MTTLWKVTLALAAAVSPRVAAVQLDVNSISSIKSAARVVADGLQSMYQNNQSSTPPTAVGTLPAPLYWWEAGAMWGAMVDYWAYTNDPSYNEVTTQALLAQVGPNNNYMPPAYFSSLGNDDQAFWAFAALSAQEYGFPVPSGQKESLWIDLATAVWNTQVPRWDTSTCGGGLRWQIFESNPGYTYKNSVSNGALFQISARLAQLTGNQTYIDWAEKSWDWMSALGLISTNYQVFDGTDSTKNCTELNHIAWTYNSAMLLFGTAVMAKHTSSSVWQDRTQSLLATIERSFFSPYQNASNIMYEPACEPFNTCNSDQLSFKAYLSRWLAKAAVAYPPIANDVRMYLQASANAAAQSCTGGGQQQLCGQKWYVGGYDGSKGAGQELSALETIQALLIFPVNEKSDQPSPGPQTSTSSIQAAPATSGSTVASAPTTTSVDHTSQSMSSLMSDRDTTTSTTPSSSSTVSTTSSTGQSTIVFTSQSSPETSSMVSALASTTSEIVSTPASMTTEIVSTSASTTTIPASTSGSTTSMPASQLVSMMPMSATPPATTQVDRHSGAATNTWSWWAAAGTIISIAATFSVAIYG